MAVARSGVYADDYLEYSSTLAADMRRLLPTIRELDDRVDEGKIPPDELAILAYPVPIANKGEKKSRGI